MCLLLACVFAATAADSTVTAEHVYIVRFSGQSLVDFAARRAQGLVSSLGSRKLALRAELGSAAVAAQRDRLDSARVKLIDRAEREFGRAFSPRHVYRYALDGMAVRLNDSEASRLAALPGVVSVSRQRYSRPLTDAGPEWIGADSLWNGQVAGLPATKGEGVVVGVIDTGINPTHPSFAASGADGYAITNPRRHFFGLCQTGEATCNSKLIGIYDFTSEGTKGIDSVGHGSHVSGIVAGDAMVNSLHGHTVSLPRFVSGVAPHANLIMYKACVAPTPDNSSSTCAESDLMAAIDQAIADNVDVINYSIGGGSVDPYQLLRQSNNDAAALFRARQAGIVVVTAAGNEGPGAGSIDEPGNAPWVIAVANATHDRRFVNSIGDLSGVAGAPAALSGVGYTSGYGPAPIVYAGDYGNALCGTGPMDYPPTGASNPFAPGTFDGQIVVCDRGTYARVEKGYNVKLAGAGGYILANAPSDGESIVSDDHYLPAVHLGYTEGKALEDWLKIPGTHTGTISGVSANLNDSYGDILNASSSRGPYGYGGGILKPDITAPGTDILSAAQNGTGLALLSGTSMASPHVAGAAALLIALHPDWSPAQVESALLGTALSGSVRKADAVTPATPLDAGTGRVQVAAAAVAGLYLPLSASDFLAQDPALGGDPAKLNKIGLENENCLGNCSFTRTVADMSGGGSWQASATATTGARISVSPSQFTLGAGASQPLNIAVDVSDPRLPGSWIDGRIVLHKTGGGRSAPDTALTLAVYASEGKAPAFRQITSTGPAGDTQLTLGGLTALPQATFTTTSLEPADVTGMSLGVDSNSDKLYDTFPGNGKQFVLFALNGVDGDVNPAGADGVRGRVFIVEMSATNAIRVNLYAGIDSNGDGQPEEAEQACQSQSINGALVRCVVDLKDAPTTAVNAWALVDVPPGGTAVQAAITLSGAVPVIGTPTDSGYDNSNGALVVTGPGHVAAGASFPLHLAWGPVLDSSNRAFLPGTYYGAILIDAVPGLGGQGGFLPFSLVQAGGGNDVTDPLEPDATRGLVVEPGESLRHRFIDVNLPTTLQLSTQYADATHVGPVDFYVVRSDFPASSSSAQVDAAPLPTSGSPQWALGGAVTNKSVTVPVNAGRWYIVASSAGSSEAHVMLHATLEPDMNAISPGPAAYYNPKRSGHGIFLSQAGGVQVLYWYTFHDDGTPVWYAASAPMPGPFYPVWQAPLYSVTWDGGAVNKTTVRGDVIITPIRPSTGMTPVTATEFIYSWHLGGSAGSEHFTRIGYSDACVDVNGGQVHLDGQWYAPTQSGYGMDVLALPNVQNDTFYFYDALGMPRWAAGSAPAFTASTTEDMYQLSGFCPTCAAVSTTANKIGTLSVDYSSASTGHFSAHMNLIPPLSGAWDINQPTARITGTSACTQY